jgi:hypothetical protein
MNRRFCLLLCAVVARNVFAAQPLGRLFYTPAERARMETTQDTPEVPEPARYDGMVESNTGRRTVWVDGQPHQLPVTEKPEPGTIGGAPDELLRGGRIVTHPGK